MASSVTTGPAQPGTQGETARVARLPVSSLKEQYYCELQVDLQRHHELSWTSEEREAGVAGHLVFEEEADPTTREEVAARRAAGEAMALVEWSLLGSVDGLPLVGKPDHVRVAGPRAELVLDFKFSRSPGLYAQHVVQAEAYGVLLEQDGSDVSSLAHCIAVLPPGSSREGLAEQLSDRALALAHAAPWPKRAAPPARPGAPDPMAGLPVRRAGAGPATLYVFPHRPERALEHLRWSLDYWRGARPPLASASPGKCRACRLNAAGLCSQAASPPDGRYQVERLESEGKVRWVVAPAKR